MAAFHTFFMKKFLAECEYDVLDITTCKELIISIEREMLEYDFTHIVLSPDNIQFVDMLHLENIHTMIAFSESGNYNFSGLHLHIPGQSPSLLENYIATLNTRLIQEKFIRIENAFSRILYDTESFESLREMYSASVKEILSHVKTTDEYMYIRIFADMYLSSFEYITEYLLSKNPSKGKLWDTIKEAWNIAKPIVGADVGGAVTGAMAGTVSGPGIVATGMAGACGASATYCIGPYYWRLK